MRFRKIENQAGYAPGNPDSGSSTVNTAMIFDYDMLLQNYDISLDVENGFHDDVEEEEKSIIVQAPPSIFSDVQEDE